MTKMSEKLDSMFRALILLLFGIFVSYLVLLSLFSTQYAFVGEAASVSDSPVKALILYILLVGAVCLWKKLRLSRYLEPYHKLIKAVGAIGLFVFLVWFILSTQLEPHGDQLAICSAADQIQNYNFSQFVRGNYFDYWPFQSRIVVFLWFFFRIFGPSNYPAFHFLNAVSIVVCLHLVSRIFCLTMHGEEQSRAKENLIFLACMMFLPFLMYVTFIYGNLPGLAFVLGAIYWEVRFMKEHKSYQLALTALLCAVGVWLKNTYLIFVVAIVVFLLVDFWQRRRASAIVGGVCVVAAISLINMGSDLILEHRMGFELSEGSPMIAWVTMAFGEDENGNPVKFDGYNIDVYTENDRDTARAQEAAFAELGRRLESLTDTPGHFIRFMGRKLAIEWNEPTFESVVANNRQYPQVEKPESMERLLQQDNRSILVKYANLFHAMVLLGCVTWVFLKGKKALPQELFFALIFVGGFLFQLFWETAAQYTLPFFLLLIPYAVTGYLAAGERVLAAVEGKRVDRMMFAGYGAAAVVILLTWVSGNQVVHDLFKVDHDTAAYTEHLNEIISQELADAGAVEDGHYIVTPVTMPDYGIAVLGELSKDEAVNQAAPVRLVPLDEDHNGILEIHHEYNYDLLRPQSTQLLLSLSGEPDDPETVVGQDFDNACFRIIEMEEKGYAITYGNEYALTCDGEMLTIKPFDGNDSQIWTLQRR